MFSMDNNHTKLTKMRNRSEAQKLGLFLGIFVFMVEITNRWWIRGNQKLLIPYDVGSSRGMAWSSRIWWIGEGIRGGGRRTRWTRQGESIQTHAHTPSGYSRGPESPTQIQSNHKKRHKGRILVERSNSKPNGRIERVKRSRLLELQSKSVELDRVQ